MAVLFLLLAVVALGFLLANRQKGKKVLAEMARLTAENAALAVFKDILDAKQEAGRILQGARNEAEALKRNAAILREGAAVEIRKLLADAKDQSEGELALAQAEARKLIDQAKANSDEVTRKAFSVIDLANADGKIIVENATRRAEEIAGSAFEAVRDAERSRSVAIAMKNIIEGYGDQYIVPSSSLLDELADDYGFTEAGEALKGARNRSRRMVKGRTAAACDYVENNRKTTAISFVVDAFNGKVDSILSRTKGDNFGTLEQGIRDAFNLVNHNGSAFRNARIETAYLEARLTELRLAATVMELKLRDKEEQRRIKEQIREEEKAQRDFERAMREAAKEEDLLKKAMAKIQAQVDKASDEQRGKYEAQLAEMAQKLREAEERSQRAMSMAQQTRMGHVYVISNVGSFGEDVFKIGLTRRLDPQDRVQELGNASVPFSFDVHAMIASDDAPTLETKLHQHFMGAQVNKVNTRKEFFRVPITIIREEIEALGIATKWTLAAEARQFRETLAIEKELRENPEHGRQWMAMQEKVALSLVLEENEEEEAVV